MLAVSFNFIICCFNYILFLCGDVHAWLCCSFVIDGALERVKSFEYACCLWVGPSLYKVVLHLGYLDHIFEIFSLNLSSVSVFRKAVVVFLYHTDRLIYSLTQRSINKKTFPPPQENYIARNLGPVFISVSKSIPFSVLA